MTDKNLISKNTSYFIRGIAIIMVVMSHYFAAAESVFGDTLIVRIISSLGDPGVGIFFFLSGYALYKGYENRKPDGKYVLKRFKNTYFPYLVIEFLIILYAGEIDGPKRILHLLLGRDSWFIVTILIFYIVFFFAGKFLRLKVWLVSVFVLGMTLFLYRMNYAIFWYNVDWCFPFGMIVANISTKIPAVWRGFSIDIKDHVFCFLGKLSIYIFLIHLFVYYRVINFEPVLKAQTNWYILMLISFGITVLLAALIEKMFKLLYKGVSIVAGKFIKSKI